MGIVHRLRQRRGGPGLHGRVRWLFAVFTITVAGVYAVQLVIERPTGPVHPLLAALALTSLVGWSLAHHADRWPRFVTDGWLLLTLAGLALTLPAEGWIWGPSLLVIFQRNLDASRIAAWIWTALSFTAYQTVIGRTEGFELVASLNTAANGVGFVVATVIIRTLADVLRAHERSARWERILADGTSRLLAATSLAEVRTAATAVARELGGGEAAAAAFWVRSADGARFSPASVAGDYPSTTPVDVDLLPRGYRDALEAGHPFVAEGELGPELSAAVDFDGALPSFVTVPLRVDGRTGSAIVLFSHEVGDGMAEVLVRFAHEVSLASQRNDLLDQLRAANEQLRHADELKDQFVSTVSHELRTPLTAMCGFAETLSARWSRFSDEERLEYLGIIRQQAERQRHLVEDLLTVSRILSGRVDPDLEPVDVGDALDAATTQLGVVVEDGLRAADAAPSPRVLVDEEHLVQVLTNLIGNADKYGAAPLTVSAREVGDRVRIEVRDHGPGVPIAFRDRMFERFTQSGGGDRRTETGVGLGLAICRDLIEVNGGSLRYEEPVGPGALFVIELPRATIPEASGAGVERERLGVVAP